MSDPEEFELMDSAVRKCACGVLAFEPQVCAKCEADARKNWQAGLAGRRPPYLMTDELCTDCRTDCDVCHESFCKEHLEAHGCKRKADPADVIVLSGAYEGHWTEALEEVYSINGRTYFVLRSRLTNAMEPASVRVFRYKGAGERDVLRGDIMEARPYIDDEEVGTVMPDGSTDWYDDEEVAGADHHAAEGR